MKYLSNIGKSSAGHKSPVLFCSFVIGFMVLFNLLAYRVNAQWRELLHSSIHVDKDGTGDYGGYFTTICFLDSVGAPDIGFVGSIGCVFRTSDGGFNWNEIDFPALDETLIYDFTFKDSLTGWFVDGPGDGSACYRTTDGGITWLPLDSVTGDVTGIYYDIQTDGLFLSTINGAAPAGYHLSGNTDELSWDQGSTWYPFALIGVESYGFAFANGDTGLMPSDAGNSYYPWWRTTDGGHTWNTVALDLPCWQPLAIPETQTYFANTFGGTILRTDDAGDTWKILSQVPVYPPVTPEFSVSSGCIAGQINNLFALTDSGCYLSVDSGRIWRYLCGVSTSAGYATRFFVRGNYVFITSEDTIAHLWELNIDSMQYFSYQIASQFPSALKDTTVTPGSTVTVNYLPTTDANIGIDTAHFAIHFDSNSLNLKNLIIPPGWSTLKSSSTNGTLDLWIISSSAVPLPTPVLQITFGTFLSSTSAKVYLDSANLIGQRLNCDCAALSLAPSDSVEIDFTGCGDSTLLALMNHGAPFSIESIQPNPAQEEIRVELSGAAQPTVEMYDALGREVLAQGTTPQPPPSLGGGVNAGAGSGVRLDVSSVPSGIYYLRLMSDGYVESRSVVVQK